MNTTHTHNSQVHDGHHDEPKGHSEHDHHGGHDHHAHHAMMVEDFRRRFFVSILVTIPILLLSPMIQNWLGIDIAFPGGI